MTTPLPRLGALCCAFGLSLASAIAQTGFSNWESAQVNPLALTPSGNTLLAVNTADNRLEVFDTSGGTTRWVRSISVGVEPVSVRARSETQAWVVNSISDSISIVDLPSGRVIRTLGTGDEPADVVFAGSPLRAFVSNSQANQVQVFDPTTGDMVTYLDLGLQGLQKLREMEVSDGRIHFLFLPDEDEILVFSGNQIIQWRIKE